jgi:hypothetical protein
MHILAELHTQRKASLEKGEEVPSHMVELSFEELMAGRVQPSPDKTPKEKEKRISAFQFMVEFLAHKFRGAKGWEADMCSIPLQQQTNFTASDETCCPGKYGNKGERQVYTAGYQPERNGTVAGRYQSVQ